MLGSGTSAVGNGPGVEPTMGRPGISLEPPLGPKALPATAPPPMIPGIKKPGKWDLDGGREANAEGGILSGSAPPGLGMAASRRGSLSSVGIGLSKSAYDGSSEEIGV